jgi:hypothetical protein
MIAESYVRLGAVAPGRDHGELLVHPPVHVVVADAPGQAPSP